MKRAEYAAAARACTTKADLVTLVKAAGDTAYEGHVANIPDDAPEEAIFMERKVLVDRIEGEGFEFAPPAPQEAEQS